MQVTDGADDQIKISDGRHAGHCRKKMTKPAIIHKPVLAKWKERSNGGFAAADELIAGDDDVRNNDGDGGQHASSGVVARFEQIGNGELREMAGRPAIAAIKISPSQPPAGCHSAAESMFIGIFRPARRLPAPIQEENRVRPVPANSVSGQATMKSVCVLTWVNL